MNHQAFTLICTLFDTAHAPYQVFTHPECRTSEESARVRKEAGMPEAIGAKALLCKFDIKGGGSFFTTLVLPGTHTLDKQKLKTGIPELKSFRFATSEELLEMAGVVPGCMPPFGDQIFPNIKRLYISSALTGFDNVAFNAAKLETSIILKTQDYLSCVTANGIFDYSSPK